MKKVFLGILAIGSLSAQASMLEVNGPLDSTFFEAQVNNDEKTYFETLGDLFRTGTRPNLSKISNIAWAGRCFNDKQNEPVNAGYIFRQKRIDAGPIAATSKAYEAISYWQLSEAPNYFDKMNLEQVFAALPNLKANDARIKTDSVEVDVQAPEKSNLKISGNYLVEEISGPVGPVGKISIGVRCYYFIPDLND